MVLNSFNIFAMIFINHLMIDSLQPLLIDLASKDVAWLSAVLSTLGAVVQPISHGKKIILVIFILKINVVLKF